MTTFDDLSPEELVRASSIEIINQSHIGAIDEHYHPDATYYNSAHEAGTIDDLKEDLRRFNAAFSGLEASIDHVIVDGTTVTYYYTVRGRHTGEFEGIPPTGEHFESQGIGFMELSDGLIETFSLVFDRLGMLEQLGVI